MGQIGQWNLPKELTSKDIRPAANLLAEYFYTRLSDGVPFHSGAMFETFAGGGDRSDVADCFTADDLVAVSLLSVDVPGIAALRILGTRAKDLNALLEQIPTDRDLRDSADLEVGPGSPADDLWRALRNCRVGPVTTSKLLARKRPKLLPVIDSVVKEVLGHPRKASYWLSLRAHLTANNDRLHDNLLAVREKADVGENISVVRCFDVVVWMIGKRDGVGTKRGRY